MYPIRRIVEKELVDDYQKNSRPSEEVRCALEEIVGENWREEQGVTGRNYIMMVAKGERTKKRESMKTGDENGESEETKEEAEERKRRIEM